MAGEDDHWRRLGMGRRNPDRVAHPFRLASVCRLWRALVLGLPILWTYICIPDPTSWSMGATAGTFINLLAERSKACPVDVLLRWDDPAVQWELGVDVPRVVEDCFVALVSCRLSWRTFEYHAPAGGLQADAVEILLRRLTLPDLERLSISCPILPTIDKRVACNRTLITDLLRDCPRLVEARLHVESLEFAGPILTLRELTVSSPTMVDSLWGILRDTPNIEFLQLAAGRHVQEYLHHDLLPHEHNELMANPIVLDSLEVMSVTCPLFTRALDLASRYLVTPHLTDIYVPYSVIWRPQAQADFIAFLRRNGGALMHLTIDEDIAAHQWHREKSGLRLYASLEFWRTLFAPDENGKWIAPRLCGVRVLGMGFLPEGGKGFADLHRRRVAAHHSDDPIALLDLVFVQRGRRRGFLCDTFNICTGLYDLPWTADEWDSFMTKHPRATCRFNATDFLRYRDDEAFEYV
ncbi:hypothetical protein AURDEDRAFT_166911 [Auricularia subglabra TFB-10046 SS5]|nr:hypothetical protein AURDEDRAFT_166911 [Auricularia subglabra TFB-10046 SS5]